MHVDNFFLILLAGAFVLLRLFAQRAGKTKSNPPPSPRQRDRDNQTEEERMRRFLEALGQPVTAKPPPKVTSPKSSLPPVVQAPRKVVTERDKRAARSPWASPLPPLTTAPPVQPFEPARSEQKTDSEYQAVTAASDPAIMKLIPPGTPSREAIVSAAAAKPARAGQDLHPLLTSPSGLRTAVLLREILGVPRGLQPVELL